MAKKSKPTASRKPKTTTKKLVAFIQAKRHLWRTNTSPTTISESDALLQDLVVEFEMHLSPEQLAKVERAI